MADAMRNRSEIKLPNGCKLVAEQNTDPEYAREMLVGIEDADGTWLQNLAIIRSSYHYDDDEKVVWDDKQFDVLVYGDEDNEDPTDSFAVELHQYEKISPSIEQE